jgi:hypothetical protein
MMGGRIGGGEEQEMGEKCAEVAVTTRRVDDRGSRIRVGWSVGQRRVRGREEGDVDPFIVFTKGQGRGGRRIGEREIRLMLRASGEQEGVVGSGGGSRLMA